MGAESWIHEFWAAMAAHLIQSTIVVALLFGLAATLRRAPAAVVHGVWLLALVKILLPLPLIGRLVGRLAPALDAGRVSGLLGDGPVAHLAVTPLGAPGAAWPGPVWLTGIATLLWTAVVAFALLAWARSARAHRPAARGGDPGGKLGAALAGTPIPRDRVRLTDEHRMPAACGALRPRILVPRALVDALSVDELRGVLLHEEAHCRRRDPLVAHAARFAAVLFFFHPLLWPALRRLRESAELACDEWVLARGTSAATYRRALQRAIGLGLFPVSATASAGVRDRSSLRRRLERIRQSRRYPMTKLHRIVLAAGVALVAAASFLPIAGPSAGDAEAEPAPDGTLLAGVGDVSNPRLIPESKVEPVYPRKAVEERREGAVILQARIDETGHVAELQTLRSAAPDFAEAAIEAVRQWRYRPAEQDGKPVAVYFTVFIEFMLNHDESGNDDGKDAVGPV